MRSPMEPSANISPPPLQLSPWNGVHITLVPCTILKWMRAALGWMGDSTYYRYRDRADERACTLHDIRHHPMATYDTVAHVVKYMWDAEVKHDDFARPEDAAKAWKDLHTHLARMLATSIEFETDPHDHSVRVEWLKECGGAGVRGQEDGEAA